MNIFIKYMYSCIYKMIFKEIFILKVCLRVIVGIE